MKKPFIKSAILLILSSVIFYSCNTDRVDPPTLESLDSFYEDNAEEEQEFIITTDSGDCIIAKKGTVLCPNRYNMQEVTGDSINLPYTLKITELYGVKDYVLNKKTTLSDPNVLGSPAIFKLGVEDNGIEGEMRNGEYFTAKLATGTYNSGLGVYYAGSDWTAATDGSFAEDSTYTYKLGLGTLDWTNIGKTESSSTATVTLTINATGTEHIGLYAITPSYEGVVMGSNLVINNVPTGVSTTIIAFALDSDGDFLLYTNEVTLSGDTTLEIEFDETTSDKFIEYLGTL